MKDCCATAGDIELKDGKEMMKVGERIIKDGEHMLNKAEKM